MKKLPDKIIIYRSNFGFRPRRWDRLMNRLWYLAMEKNNRWALITHNTLAWFEVKYYSLTRKDEVEY